MKRSNNKINEISIDESETESEMGIDHDTIEVKPTVIIMLTKCRF